MKKVLISGSLAFDTIMDFPGVFTDHIIPEKLHALSLSFLVENVKQHFGGTAGNIAYSLSLIGGNPVILSQWGNDAQRYRHHLTKHRVDCRSIRAVTDIGTASAWIMTDRKDNQIAAFHPGAMKYPASSVSRWKKNQYAMAICAPGSSRDRLALAAWCRKTKTPFLFDPGQGLTDMDKTEILLAMKGSFATIVNDYECDLLLKRLSCTKKHLWDWTNALVMTLGERGSAVETKEGDRWGIRAVQARSVVDPTGAGDAFRAGLIAGLVHQCSWKQSMQIASTVATYAVESVGTQEHLFTLTQLAQRYEKAYHQKFPLT